MTHQQEQTQQLDVEAEFERQVQTLLDASYARESGLTRHGGRPGFVSDDTSDIDRFEAVEAVELPGGVA